jgi:hypothetical protein
VADRATHNRSITEAREQTEEAFEQVTKSFCNNVVKHCHDWIDNFLTTEDAGDLQQCGTLAGVIKHLPVLKAAKDQSAAMNNTPFQPSSPPPSPPASSSASAIRNLRTRH